MASIVVPASDAGRNAANAPKSDTGKQHHKQCTGVALETAKQHQKPQDITLSLRFLTNTVSPRIDFELRGANPLRCFCGADEVDPYAKPQELLDISPKGLVPAIKLNNFNPPRGLYESTVIMEYLEDLASLTTKRSLLPTRSNPYSRALARLQSDHVNRTLVPAFYRYLQAQTEREQVAMGKEFHAAIEGLVELLERAEREVVRWDGAAVGEGEKRVRALGLGLWIEGGDLGWTDVMAGPFIFRATNVLKHYKGFTMPTGTKFDAWLRRLFNHPSFKATCSTEDLYLDSYERYAFNRANTSQVATAINEGRSLP
ncbi:putative glutathione S-transferase, N-terminal domain [Lyophyllum shimeji]|uniref:Glutathione S-transferase, N-terminal domain n=1 Tax=Lyophyllum shimeji TaxID=47721 RepID=A0A9P3UK92_LYOSH|nr:putative glutathione S-transferase, N-terminal domain [Lyophyllum shimeji]